MKPSHSRVHMLRLVFFLSFSAPFLFVGCGKYGTLYGTVTYKGKPVPKATITFLCSDSVAVTNADDEGNYRVSKVPRGSAKVSLHNLTQIMPTVMSQMAAPGKTKDAPNKDTTDTKATIAAMMKKLGATDNLLVLPLKANDPERSGIEVEVLGGGQQFDIEVTD